MQASRLKDFRLHDIRHSLVSKLVQQECSLYEVAALLGHSSPNTSARYSHLEKKSVAEKAANVLNALNTK
jgi:site-specific recombinase XerD